MGNAPVKHFTRCESCAHEVGAVHDGFSSHDPAREVIDDRSLVWKTSVHRRNGQRCPGSRLQVSPIAVSLAL